ncbi:acetylglutamate kinase [Geobacillus sp. C56-T2]|uniref:acetylglutamate kinase n=1 Tax=Geobacillus sp. C56-T2 TaxID=600773 RepID=UPI0011AA2DD8|nr:acetylglutamate kinase [Geobacillus sp. C56-T2]NNV07745.1 acetylglutamate kinase [Geobacillus sp. MMMUD3]TWG29713.1 N-acetylglutamate kinase [Geobacillus sp. C56-T2]
MGNTVVIKCGGSVLDELSPAFFASVKTMREQGMNVVIVHGGGPEIGRMLKKLAVPSEFVNGLRKTTKDVLAVVEMVLSGQVNKQLVAMLTQRGLPAVGVSGVDGGLLEAEPIDLNQLGYVGRVKTVRSRLLRTLLEAGYIPVISPLGVDQSGQTYNINADTAAGAVAAAIGASQLAFVTNVPGILQDGALVEEATAEMVEQLLEAGVITGGMIPKVKAALSALSDALPEVVIVSGKTPFYEQGTWHGTTIRKENEVGVYSS